MKNIHERNENKIGEIDKNNYIDIIYKLNENNFRNQRKKIFSKEFVKNNINYCHIEYENIKYNLSVYLKLQNFKFLKGFMIREKLK